MKFLTLILTTFILFFTVKPGIDAISLQVDNAEQSCYSRQCTTIPNSDGSPDQEQKQKNDCDGQPCNSFQVCSSCVLFCLAIPYDYLPKPIVSTKQGFTNQSASTSLFPSGVWHPPKVV